MQISWKLQLLLLLVLGVASLPFGALFIYLCISIYSFKGSAQAIHALTISWLLNYLNPGIFPQAGYISNIKWIVLLIALATVIREIKIYKIRRITQIKLLLIFSSVLIGLSLINSYAITVSILKIIQFTIGCIVILCGYAVCRVKNADLVSWFFNFFFFITIFSLLFFTTNIGFLKNGRGFQGIFNHPQAYGVFLAPMLAWVTATYLMTQKKSPAMLVVIVAGWFSLFATQARTGLLSIILALITTSLLMLFRSQQQKKKFVRTILNSASIGCYSLVVIFMVINFDLLYMKMADFLVKHERELSLVEGFEKSRGFLVGRSMQNFQENPLAGIGFGIASDPEKFVVTVDNTFGLPTGAAVEKGFLPSALLEETGIIGTVFFLMFLFTLVKPVVKNVSAPMAALFFSCFFVNFGEMVFFSFGGNGLYIWLLMGMAIEQGRIIEKSL